MGYSRPVGRSIGCADVNRRGNSGHYPSGTDEVLRRYGATARVLLEHLQSLPNTANLTAAVSASSRMRLRARRRGTGNGHCNGGSMNPTDRSRSVSPLPVRRMTVYIVGLVVFGAGLIVFGGVWDSTKERTDIITGIALVAFAALMVVILLLALRRQRRDPEQFAAALRTAGERAEHGWWAENVLKLWLVVAILDLISAAVLFANHKNGHAWYSLGTFAVLTVVMIPTFRRRWRSRQGTSRQAPPDRARSESDR